MEGGTTDAHHSLSEGDRADVLTLVRQGDTLAINGAPLDLSQVEAGDTLPAEAISSDLIAGPVRRIDGKLQIPLILPYTGSDEEVPTSVRFPAPITVTKNGPISLPTGPSEPSPAAPPMAVNWSLLEKYERAPDPVLVLFPADLWSRASDAEAEAIDQAMTAQPLRIRRLFQTAQTYQSDDPLWPLLMGAAVDLFGEERAAELLAPSAEMMAAGEAA